MLLEGCIRTAAYGISDGVSGLDPGGGRLMRVGCEACDMMLVLDAVNTHSARVNMAKTLCREALRSRCAGCPEDVGEADAVASTRNKGEAVVD